MIADHRKNTCTDLGEQTVCSYWLKPSTTVTASFFAYSPFPENSSKDEGDAKSSIFDSFYGAGGGERMIKVTNFAPMEFPNVWNVVNEQVSANWNAGSGAGRLTRE